jgi:hypothetical protein
LIRIKAQTHRDLCLKKNCKEIIEKSSALLLFCLLSFSHSRSISLSQETEDWFEKKIIVYCILLNSIFLRLVFFILTICRTLFANIRWKNQKKKKTKFTWKTNWQYNKYKMFHNSSHSAQNTSILVLCNWNWNWLSTSIARLYFSSYRRQVSVAMFAEMQNSTL